MGIFNDNGYDTRDGRKEPKYIKGVSCDVKNCAYHDGELHCTADRIAVGPSFANSCADTVCATFKEKTRL